jgi:hypothetical protein
METLPHDAIGRILGHLLDVRSIASFAMASRRCRDAVARADLVRRFCLPHGPAWRSWQPHSAPRGGVHPDNEQAMRNAPHGFTYCTFCCVCKEMIPVLLEAVVVNHKCRLISTHGCVICYAEHRGLLYRGPTQHLTQPMPCCQATLKTRGIKRPTVYPYAPLQA